MDNTTQFIDTLHVLTGELEDLRKHIGKLDSELTRICSNLPRGDVRDRETRVSKLYDAKTATEGLQNFISYTVDSRVFKLCGSLETLHTILDEKENEVWIVRETKESLTAPQVVDRLTDAITDYMLEHVSEKPSPKSAFVDNPDNFVAEFVSRYLNHSITDRMSDMVISLVTDWMCFRLAD